MLVKRSASMMVYGVAERLHKTQKEGSHANEKDKQKDRAVESVIGRVKRRCVHCACSFMLTQPLIPNQLLDWYTR